MEPKKAPKSDPADFAAQHALFWLMVANGVGLWLAILLLFPELNRTGGEFTYGRLVPLHLNFQLYGWTSLPLVAWLFRIYPSSSTHDCEVARGAVLIWSLSLLIGGVSWLLGSNGGKIFLEWQGFSRVLFAFALLFLWCSLAARFSREPRSLTTGAVLRAVGLIALIVIIPVWYWAASPSVYPAINPQTSGPTAASLLGSTLAVVLILLIAAPSLGEPKGKSPIFRVCWIAFFFEMLLFAATDKGNLSHRSWSQIALLGTLLVWVPLLPLYFRAFDFPADARDLSLWFLAWLGLLTVTGWFSFLPEMIDRWKFTNVLVAHSHLAMAGFVTNFNLFLMHVLRERGSTAFISKRSFVVWNAATFCFIALMWTAGIIETKSPGFTILPGALRTTIYSGRALCGVIMFACSAAWWRGSLLSAQVSGFVNKTDNVPEALCPTV